MNSERTMEFILRQQAKFEENFLRSNRRLDRIEHGLAETQRVLAQTNRVVGKLASTGVVLRSDIRRHERAIARHDEMMAEMEDKLNALIDIVDKSTRRNGKK